MEPPLGRPDIGEVGHLLLVRHVGRELAIEHIADDDRPLAMILGRPEPYKHRSHFDHNPDIAFDLVHVAVDLLPPLEWSAIYVSLTYVPLTHSMPVMTTLQTVVELPEFL